MTTQLIGEEFIQRCNTGTGIDQEQRNIGLAECFLGLEPHPAREFLVRLVLKPRGIEHIEIERADTPGAAPPVTGQPRRVMDKRYPLADKPVEQRGFAHIGAAYQRDGEAHDMMPLVKGDDRK